MGSRRRRRRGTVSFQASPRNFRSLSSRRRDSSSPASIGMRTASRQNGQLNGARAAPRAIASKVDEPEGRVFPKPPAPAPGDAEERVRHVVGGPRGACRPPETGRAPGQSGDGERDGHDRSHAAGADRRHGPCRATPLNPSESIRRHFHLAHADQPPASAPRARALAWVGPRPASSARGGIADQAPGLGERLRSRSAATIRSAAWPSP